MYREEDEGAVQRRSSLLGVQMRREESVSVEEVWSALVIHVKVVDLSAGQRSLGYVAPGAEKYGRHV